MFSRLTIRSLTATLLALLAGACVAAEAPNFVFILSDDQSWVGTSIQMIAEDSRTKSDFFRTPHIERLAKRGMNFSQAYSPGASCHTTRRAILVGQTPARHVFQRDQTRWPQAYRERLTIPRMLKRANPEYRTAHFGKWDLRHDRPTPEEMGYDVSDGYTTNLEGGGKNSKLSKTQLDPKLIFSLTERATDFAREQKAAGRPFFIQISHYAVHMSIFYRQESLAQTRQWTPGTKHYDPGFAAMTADLDAGIGRLLDNLEALGLMENTYIFFMSDNGGRRTLPHLDGPVVPRNFPLRGAKHSLYEGGIRVPFIVAGPGISAGTSSKVAVTGLDLLPTLAELAGYKQPLPDDIDGGSIRPVLSNNGVGVVKRNLPFLLFHQAGERVPMTSLITEDYKLVRTGEGYVAELYDLSRDIEEAKNLAELLPEKTAELSQQAENFLRTVDAQMKATEQHRHGKLRKLKKAKQQQKNDPS